jgi:hypothetical protein
LGCIFELIFSRYFLADCNLGDVVPKGVISLDHLDCVRACGPLLNLILSHWLTIYDIELTFMLGFDIYLLSGWLGG